MSETPYPAQNSTLAVISLIAGIGAWSVFPFIGGIVAIIMGHMARREIRESEGALSGEGLSLIGLILGYTNIIFLVLLMCIGVALLFGLPIFFFSLDTNVEVLPLF